MDTKVALGSTRLELIRPDATAADDFSAAVRDGLSKKQKALPCRFLYDFEGSILFERITQEPAYYLTRSERSIFEKYADEIAAHFGGDVSLVELGGGNSAKTRLLIEAVIRKQNKLHFANIDISSEYLLDCAEALLRDYEGLDVSAIPAEYLPALDALPPPSGPRVFLFLGSNIGNFSPKEATSLLCRLNSLVQPEDAVLVGLDRKKDAQTIINAYNDAAGITAAFNKNILARVNCELCGDFVPANFEHFAPYLEDLGHVEMRLVSKLPQTVRVEEFGEEYDFEAGEYIHTEDSYKYSAQEFAAIASSCNLDIVKTWSDDNDWFDVHLLKLANP